MARIPATNRIFQHKEADKRPLTSESIADHLEAFQSSGGRIEVLGNTRMLKKLDEAAVAGVSPPTPVRRGSR